MEGEHPDFILALEVKSKKLPEWQSFLLGKDNIQPALRLF